jgi:hypothetical protein
VSAELQAALARATEETRLVAYVASAASKNWRAAAWILERRYPDRWGRGQREEPPVVPSADDPFREVDKPRVVERGYALDERSAS